VFIFSVHICILAHVIYDDADAETYDDSDADTAAYGGEEL